MEYFNGKLCRLCLKTIKNGNYTPVDDIIRQILDVVLLKLNMENGHEHFICTVCSKKLYAAFQFKSTCLYTDDSIFPYIDLEKPSLVDLRVIYVKEKNSSVSDNEEICRLCMQPVRGIAVSAHEVENDALKKFIPEVNISATKNPVICKFCSDALVVHSSFIKDCLDVDNKINTVFKESDTDNKTDVTNLVLYNKSERNQKEDIIMETESKNTETRFGGIEERSGMEDLIKAEEIEIKYNDILEEDMETSHFPKNITKTRKRKASPLKNKYCDQSSSTAGSSLNTGDSNINIKTNQTNMIKDRGPSNLNINKNSSKIRLWECHVCDYKSKYAGNIRRHMLNHKFSSRLKKTTEIHKGNGNGNEFIVEKVRIVKKSLTNGDSLSPEVLWHQCHMCDYKTNQKCNLNRHLIVHRKDSEMQCSTCDYKSKNKFDLMNHALTHKAPSEVRWYQCDLCTYKAKRRSGLESHMLVHKEPSEIQWFECDLCGRKFKRKYKLNSHLLIHKYPGEVKWHHCDLCDYKCKNKCDLKRHMLIHKGASEIQWYECDTCRGKFKQKHHLKKHVLVHRDASEIQWYQCELCNRKIKLKYYFKKHMLNHKKFSEMQCDMCDYKFKNKVDFNRHKLVHKEEYEIQYTKPKLKVNRRDTC